MLSIRLRGARTHNLKAVDLDVEPGTLLVITGPSGAGKSSLAFSTLYAEGQRRYVESFSAYARQFLERLARPPVDALDPVPAAVAVDRRASVKTSRSTVASMTELSDHTRQLWLHLSTLTCPDCGEVVRRESSTSVVEGLLANHAGERIMIAYPLGIEDAEHYLAVRESLLTLGYHRVYLHGATRDLDGIRPSDVVRPGQTAGELLVIVDRTVLVAEGRARIVEALDEAFARGDNEARVIPAGAQGADAVWRFSRSLSCHGCGRRFTQPTQGLFSFNSPVGACETCRGFGRTMEVDWDKVIPDLNVTIKRRAVKAWGGRSAVRERRALLRFCEQVGIPVDVPVGQLSGEQREALLEGDGGSWRSGYPGLRRWFAWMETKNYKMHVRVFLARHRKYVPCEDCGGTRFKPEVANFRVDGLTLPQFYGLSVHEALSMVRVLQDRRPAGLEVVLRECVARLSTLCDVGLSYLTLDRAVRSLSGGELQRVGLTSALSADLRGTLFVLDEPTAGLHPVDVERLFPAVRRLAESDNVVAVVESDPCFVAGADRVVELGPEAGIRGGEIVFDGAPAALKRANTATSRALWPRGRAEHQTREVRRARRFVTLTGASGNNLRGIDLKLPLRVLTCVTGVSGSGKSSLVLDTLVRAVAQSRGDATAQPLPFDKLQGSQWLGQVVVVDQEPLGRSSRANPATYLGAWDELRKQLASTPLAKTRGYGPGTFSFNVVGGRCEACKGEGSETVEMQFMADVTFSCPECGGRRFVGPVLDVRVEGLNVSELLELTIEEAVARFARLPKVVVPLSPLVAIGAGYLKLGQPLSTLSGGEAQRLKLAAALAKVGAGDLFVLDEPTAGLHASDIGPLIDSLHRLVDAGGTVVVIEHEMAVAARADHVIDLGPGPGSQGGSIVAQGTPQEVAAVSESRTAPYLAASLSQQPPAITPRRKRRRQLGAFSIEVSGAREHNLRAIDVKLPRGKLVVVTGPSGSGKSTLAFDVIFAEAQRRYTETLSPYVRQYLKLLPRPSVDQVQGMPPAVSLEQRTTAGAASSTVATVTEVAHYLRLAYARAGILHCPDCDIPIAPRPAAILARDLARTHGSRKVTLMAPLIRGRKGLHRDRLTRARGDGYTHARIDGEVVELTPGLALDRFREHDIELVVGSLAANDADMPGLMLRALELGQGVILAKRGGDEQWLSDKRACPGCGRGFPELDPRHFSFNTRQGACETCEGTGSVEPSARRRGRKAKTKPKAQRVTCPDCDGGRLAGLALHTYLAGHNIGAVMDMDVQQVAQFLAGMELSGREAKLAGPPVAEAIKRLGFLDEVGLGYLHLGRSATGLSGGELQRVRLAAQLGSGLTGLLYVLDEPTIGLHPRDTGRLLAALRRLVGIGCTVLLVEHDADSILAADHMIDIGPGAGRKGGRVVAEGPPAKLLSDPQSITGRALSRPVAIPRRRPLAGVPTIEVTGASQHNLRGVTLSIPVGRLTVVCGVSGSGKSTLVREVFLRAVRAKLGLATDTPGEHRRVRGEGGIKRAVEIDQTPIGRTPRSVPATYVGIWDELRKLYARTPTARARGYGPSRFSFNVAAGRCPACEGQGSTTMEMAFLAKALLPCEVCGGQRFNPETLDVRLYGLTVGQVLRMEVDEVAQTFSAIPKVTGPLSLLSELGMGYLQLGQASNTLSGGEAQRLKLVSELNASGAGPTLYVMDEPTTGLHRDDVTRLLGVIDKLVDRGDTVVVIEHHIDVIAHADRVVELGPEGGAGGGALVVEGTPEDMMACAGSHTGAVLRAEIERVGSTLA